MMFRVALASLALVGGLAACNEHPVYQQVDPCPGGGEFVTNDSGSYCAFVITETGFLCPETLPHGYEAEGTGEDKIGICSDDPMEEPDDVQRAAKQALEDGRIGDEEVDSEVVPPGGGDDPDAGEDGNFSDVSDPPDVGVDAGQSERSNKLDILFIVDDSGSMCEEQQALRASAEDFVSTLVASGIDFQLGVVTTDVLDVTKSGRLQDGFDGEGGPSCPQQIDTSTCDTVLPKLLTAENYEGDAAGLENDFGCLLTQGTSGNGFEMGLEAALLATSEPLRSGANAGLIRDDADLALVFLTDENDCSDRGALDKVNGNVCEWESELLVTVEEYQDHFTSLKAGRQVLVATIAAPDDGRRYAPPSQVSPSCTSENGEGYSGWRYDQFREGFAHRWQHNICTAPYNVPGLASFLVGQ